MKENLWLHKMVIFTILFFRAALEENPYFRLKKVVKWYLSGFYKKPKVMFMFLLLFFPPFYLCLYICMAIWAPWCTCGGQSILTSWGSNKLPGLETGAFTCCGVSLPKHTENPAALWRVNSSCLWTFISLVIIIDRCSVSHTIKSIRVGGSYTCWCVLGTSAVNLSGSGRSTTASGPILQGSEGKGVNRLT